MSMKFVVPEAIADTEDVQALIDTSISEATMGSMVHILTQEVTVATQYVDFDGLFDSRLYSKYVVLMNSVGKSTNSASIEFQFISSTGVVQNSALYRYHRTVIESNIGTITGSSDAIATYGTLAMSCTKTNLTLDIASDNATTHTASCNGISESSNADRLISLDSVHWYEFSMVLGGIRFMSGNGSVNFTSGTFSMYGVLK